MKIPSSQNWSVSNLPSRGDVFYTRNINFDADGYASLANRALALIYDQASDFGAILSVVHLGGSTYYVTTSNGVYSVNFTSGTATAIANISTNLTSDCVTWAGGGTTGLLFVSDNNTTIYSGSGGSWTSRITGLTAATPHPLCVFENLVQLAVGDGNTVKTYSTAYALQATCTIPAEFTVRWIRYKDNRIYFGTSHNSGGEAKMFVWDGSGTAAQGAFATGGTWVFSGAVYKGTIVVMNSLGQLLPFNGGGFNEPLANLPVYYSEYEWLGADGFSLGKMLQRGMIADGDILYLNLNSTLSNYQFLAEQPSGLWCYDPKVGLYHKAGWAKTKLETRLVSGTDTGTDTFTVSSYNAITGTPILYTGTAAGGLVTNTVYYIIRASATTFQLATTHANAIAGTAINITSAGVSDSIVYHDDFEFGRSAGTSEQPYCVALVNTADSNISSYQGISGSQVIFGARVEDDSVQPKYTIQTLARGLNKGHIITARLQTANIKESWQKLVAKYEKLLISVDKIIVSARIREREPIYILDGTINNATWITTSSFSTSVSLSSAEVGDMVEIVGGSQAGNTSFITAIQETAGSYIVTISDTFTATNGDISAMIITNFKKKDTATFTTMDNLITSTIADNASKWVQFHIELQGISRPYIESLEPINTAHTK